MSIKTNLPSEVVSYLESTRLILPSSTEKMMTFSNDMIYEPIFSYIKTMVID